MEAVESPSPKLLKSAAAAPSSLAAGLEPSRKNAKRSLGSHSKVRKRLVPSSSKHEARHSKADAKLKRPPLHATQAAADARCPICGKGFVSSIASATNRMAHIKKCGKEKDMSAAELIAVMRSIKPKKSASSKLQPSKESKPSPDSRLSGGSDDFVTPPKRPASKIGEQPEPKRPKASNKTATTAKTKRRVTKASASTITALVKADPQEQREIVQQRAIQVLRTSLRQHGRKLESTQIQWTCRSAPPAAQSYSYPPSGMLWCISGPGQPTRLWHLGSGEYSCASGVYTADAFHESIHRAAMEDDDDHVESIEVFMRQQERVSCMCMPCNGNSASGSSESLPEAGLVRRSSSSQPVTQKDNQVSAQEQPSMPCPGAKWKATIGSSNNSSSSSPPKLPRDQPQNDAIREDTAISAQRQHHIEQQPHNPFCIARLFTRQLPGDLSVQLPDSSVIQLHHMAVLAAQASGHASRLSCPAPAPPSSSAAHSQQHRFRVQMPTNASRDEGASVELCTRMARLCLESICQCTDEMGFQRFVSELLEQPRGLGLCVTIVATLKAWGFTLLVQHFHSTLQALCDRSTLPTGVLSGPLGLSACQLCRPLKEPMSPRKDVTEAHEQTPREGTSRAVAVEIESSQESLPSSLPSHQPLKELRQSNSVSARLSDLDEDETPPYPCQTRRMAESVQLRPNDLNAYSPSQREPVTSQSCASQSRTAPSSASTPRRLDYSHEMRCPHIEDESLNIAAPREVEDDEEDVDDGLPPAGLDILSGVSPIAETGQARNDSPTAMQPSTSTDKPGETSTIAENSLLDWSPPDSPYLAASPDLCLSPNAAEIYPGRRGDHNASNAVEFDKPALCPSNSETSSRASSPSLPSPSLASPKEQSLSWLDHFARADADRLDRTEAGSPSKAAQKALPSLQQLRKDSTDRGDKQASTGIVASTSAHNSIAINVRSSPEDDADYSKVPGAMIKEELRRFGIKHTGAGRKTLEARLRACHAVSEPSASFKAVLARLQEQPATESCGTKQGPSAAAKPVPTSISQRPDTSSNNPAKSVARAGALSLSRKRAQRQVAKTGSAGETGSGRAKKAASSKGADVDAGSGPSWRDTLFQAMKANASMYARILSCETLGLSELLAFAQKQGVGCKKDDLMDFCDHYGITFSAPRKRK